MRSIAHRRRQPLRLTGAHIARVARDVPDPGPTNRYTQLTDADRVALADRLLAENAGAPFWVFAYGSLIWKPAFENVDNRNCIAHGWRRSFCLNIQGWRATPEQPGLMLALAKGGACSGIAYRMPDDDPQGRMLRLLDRAGQPPRGRALAALADRPCAR